MSAAVTTEATGARRNIVRRAGGDTDRRLSPKRLRQLFLTSLVGARAAVKAGSQAERGEARCVNKVLHQQGAPSLARRHSARTYECKSAISGGLRLLVCPAHWALTGRGRTSSRCYRGVSPSARPSGSSRESHNAAPCFPVNETEPAWLITPTSNAGAVLQSIPTQAGLTERQQGHQP